MVLNMALSLTAALLAPCSRALKVSWQELPQQAPAPPTTSQLSVSRVKGLRVARLHGFSGRTGNNIVETAVAIHVALQEAAGCVCLPGHELLRRRAAATTPGSDCAVCHDASTGDEEMIQEIPRAIDYWDEAWGRYDLFGSAPRARELLAEIWNVSADPDGPAAPPDTVHVHLRGGDVMSNIKNIRHMVQPPCSFYERELGRRRYRQIVVVSEDTANPCVNRILGSNAGAVYRGEHRPLVEDMQELLGARHLMIGHGTFMPALISLSQRAATIHLCGDGDTRMQQFLRVHAPPGCLIHVHAECAGFYERAKGLKGGQASSRPSP